MNYALSIYIIIYHSWTSCHKCDCFIFLLFSIPLKCLALHPCNYSTHGWCENEGSTCSTQRTGTKWADWRHPQFLELLMIHSVQKNLQETHRKLRGDFNRRWVYGRRTQTERKTQFNGTNWKNQFNLHSINSFSVFLSSFVALLNPLHICAWLLCAHMKWNETYPWTNPLNLIRKNEKHHVHWTNHINVFDS